MQATTSHSSADWEQLQMGTVRAPAYAPAMGEEHNKQQLPLFLLISSNSKAADLYWELVLAYPSVGLKKTKQDSNSEIYKP